MNEPCRLRIDLSRQQLEVIGSEGRILRRYPVSTAANGPGEMDGSYCTPTGEHVIRARIGDGLPLNTVFVGRRPTGETYHCGMRDRHPDRDWILTRIIWLSGCEPGKNRLGDVDTMRRYIYLHGTPDDVDMSQPGSRGCVRMRNTDIVELFDLVSIGTRVCIDA